MITFSERIYIQEKYYEWLNMRSKELPKNQTIQDTPATFLGFLLINHMLNETEVKIFTSLH